MPIDYNALAIPKGNTVKQHRAKAKREDVKQLKAFRDAVWLREELKLLGDLRADGRAEIGLCFACLVIVQRFEYRPMTGEVHHRISRRHKATRYDPQNGVLLCNHLVNNCHEKAERGEITV